MSSSHLQHKPTIVLTNPVTGMSLRILTSAAESGGSLLGMEAFYPAGLGSAAALRTPRSDLAQARALSRAAERLVSQKILRNFLLAARVALVSLVCLVSGTAFGQAAAPAVAALVDAALQSTAAWWCSGSGVRLVSDTAVVRCWADAH